MYEDAIMPGRYRRVYWALKAVRYSYYFTWTDNPMTGGLNAHLGLEIFISALATAGTLLRSLDLAVDLDDVHAFITNVPEAVVAKVCQKV
jgi:hypothetical protein